jgi:hypothetical protein
VRNEERRIMVGRNSTYTKGREANWIGHILSRDCLLKEVIGGKIEGRGEVTGRRGRRRQRILDDLKEKWRYWNWKWQAIVYIFGGTRFERGNVTVSRQNTWWL